MCYASDLNAFAIVADTFPQLAPDPVQAASGGGNLVTQVLGWLRGLLEQVFGPMGNFGGMIVTAFAASSGSGYWHDQLDRIRAVKAAVGSAKNIVAQT